MIKVPAKQQGIALILVLLLVAILSVVVTSVQYRNQIFMHQASQTRAKIDAQAELLSLRSELHFLLTTTPIWLFEPNEQLRQQYALPSGFNLYGRPFKWGDTEVTLTDASGLVALIPFNEHNWRRMLTYLQVEPVEPIIASLKDWYDSDDFIHLHGAEKGDYAEPGLPRNALPQTIEELALVKNITPEIFQKIRPWLTYIGQDEVNAEYSPDAFLEAFVGPHRSEIMVNARNNPGTQVETFRVFTEDATYNPTNRLQVVLTTKKEGAAYTEQFTFVKSRGNPKTIYIAEWQGAHTGIANP